MTSLCTVTKRVRQSKGKDKKKKEILFVTLRNVSSVSPPGSSERAPVKPLTQRWLRSQSSIFVRCLEGSKKHTQARQPLHAELHCTRIAHILHIHSNHQRQTRAAQRSQLVGQLISGKQRHPIGSLVYRV